MKIVIQRNIGKDFMMGYMVKSMIIMIVSSIPKIMKMDIMMAIMKINSQFRNIILDLFSEMLIILLHKADYTVS